MNRDNGNSNSNSNSNSNAAPPYASTARRPAPEIYAKTKVKPKGHELEQVAALDPTRALYFSIVVEKNSVTLAAKALGVSASTVSRKLDELEESLAVRLLERDTRHLRLTEAGKSCLHFVRKAMGVLAAGQQTMERYSSDVVGRLRVLCPPSRHGAAVCG